MLDQIQEVLGTSLKVVINSQSPLALKAMEAVFLEAKRIEQEFSRFIPHNQLAKLNASIGQWTKVSEEFFFLLEIGKKIEIETQGAFTLSVKSILDSWGYNEKYELAKEFPMGKTGVFELKKEACEVRLTAPIEIGAIGKGYALDRMKEKLSDFPNIFINAGGDIYGRGKKEDGSPWTCYLEHPEDSEKAIGEVPVDDFFLTSSSPLRRRWRNRHHLIDARILEPANNMLSNSIEASSGIMADAYSTALFVLGYEDAKSFAVKHNVKALLIGKHKDIFISPGFLGNLYQKN